MKWLTATLIASTLPPKNSRPHKRYLPVTHLAVTQSHHHLYRICLPGTVATVVPLFAGMELQFHENAGDSRPQD
jgi:hypothetical protein